MSTISSAWREDEHCENTRTFFLARSAATSIFLPRFYHTEGAGRAHSVRLHTVLHCMLHLQLHVYELCSTDGYQQVTAATADWSQATALHFLLHCSASVYLLNAPTNSLIWGLVRGEEKERQKVNTGGVFCFYFILFYFYFYFLFLWIFSSHPNLSTKWFWRWRSGRPIPGSTSPHEFAFIKQRSNSLKMINYMEYRGGAEFCKLLFMWVLLCSVTGR